MLPKLCRWRRRRVSENQKTIALVVVITLMLVATSLEPGHNNKKAFKTVLSKETVPPVKKPLKILLWTTFFGDWSWYENTRGVFDNECHLGCSLTMNKSEIEQADAIIFHLTDLTSGEWLKSGVSFSPPRYRREDQIWILFNLEPFTMIFGSLNGWQGLFNWTWSFTRNSDVFTPYGQFKVLDQDERIKAAHTFKHANPFADNTDNGGIAMITRCTDNARRYRIIEHLRQYIDIRVIGGCGENCPGNYSSCTKLLHSYKFYMALENSDCDDYVTEKYWRSIQRGQIPIVAWRLSMDGLIIPGSYINVMDFPDLDAAGRHIREVSRNEALYNSYFRWRLTHAEVRIPCWCKLCSLLKENTRPKMVYHNIQGWMYNHTCRPVAVGCKWESCQWAEFSSR